jgi:toxin ParE1/3/4
VACKLIWSTGARDDLRDLVRFIAEDNPHRAASFGLQIIRRIERIQEFPELGRIVPERQNPDLRELIIAPYRVIYRLNREEGFAEVVRIWHAARGSPSLD